MFGANLTHQVQGVGSYQVMVDMYTDTNSQEVLVNNPDKLMELLRRIICKRGLQCLGVAHIEQWPEEGTLRETDIPAVPHVGFQAIATSHTRLEWWPPCDKPSDLGYLQFEIQICNYGSDQRETCSLLAWQFVALVNPAFAHLVFIVRGPGPTPRAPTRCEYVRGKKSIAHDTFEVCLSETSDLPKDLTLALSQRKGS